MGLDIYLYSKPEYEQNESHEQECNILWNRKEKGEITESEFDDLYKQASPYVSAYTNGKERLSEKYPDHLFNRRYLRSSYNNGGFNRAVPDLLGKESSLYWIFEPMGRDWDDGDVILTRDDISMLQACRGRALSVAEDLRHSDRLRVDTLSSLLLGEAEHMWSQLPTEDDVLAWYRQEAQRDRPPDFSSYSTAKGTVFGVKSGLNVLAITLGRDVFGHPSPVIVYRSDSIDYYIQSAEIVAEFCDEAIALIEQDGSACISWSG
jgi:hypothetical protein